MMTRTLTLLGICLLLAVPASAQFGRRPPAPPLPGVPAYPPGRLPADFGAGQNPWNLGPIPDNYHGRSAMQPPPNIVDPTWFGGGFGPNGPGFGFLGGEPLAMTQPPPGGVTIYRLYTFQSAEPIYTDDFNEVVTLVRRGTHRFEGPAFFLSGQDGPGLSPMGRGVRRSGNHFLSSNPRADNRGMIEKVMGGIQSRPLPGWVPLYEWYLPARDMFLYTTDPQGEIAPAVGYRSNGAIGYVIPAK
jgi:hypothetical protein